MIENEIQNEFPSFEDGKKNVKPKEKFNDKLWQTDYGNADLTQQDDNFSVARDYEPILKQDEESIYASLTFEKIFEILSTDEVAARIVKLELKLSKSDVIYFYKLLEIKLPEVEIIEKINNVCNYFEFPIKKFFEYLPQQIQINCVKLLIQRNCIGANNKQVLEFLKKNKK